MTSLIFNKVPNYSMEGCEAVISWSQRANNAPDKLFRKVTTAIGLTIIGVTALVEAIATTILALVMLPALAFGRGDSKNLIGASFISVVLCVSSLTIYQFNNLINEIN